MTDKLTKSINAIFLYKTEEGRTICRTITHDICLVPFWIKQSEALFKPRTPCAVRVMLFNATVAENYKAGHREYAYRIDYHEDEEIGPFLALYLTPVGMTMVSEEWHNCVKGRYDPLAPEAATMWGLYKKPLRRALTVLGMEPQEP